VPDAHRLTEIRARRVSLVERAAVRDPQDPSKPRRFVLFKAESPHDERTEPMAAATTETAAQEIAKDLRDVDQTIALAKAEGAPPSHIAQLDRARRRIQKSYSEVDNPASVAAREKVNHGEHTAGGALGEFREAVDALTRKGLTRTAAMERVRRDDPELVRRVGAEERGAAINDS
jgi:hypothetical protein